MSKRYDGNRSFRPLQAGDRVTDIDRGGTGTVVAVTQDAVEGYAYVQWDANPLPTDYVCCGYLNQIESSDQEDANSKSVPSTSKGLEQASSDQKEQVGE